ncbi:MAG: threonyl-tRNA synthetase [Trizodia sp. TS-e1964]|nr:MAG: threonyl-tRNA synthetase [Trizodia sp. TS-e1964]
MEIPSFRVFSTCSRRPRFLQTNRICRQFVGNPDIGRGPKPLVQVNRISRYPYSTTLDGDTPANHRRIGIDQKLFFFDESSPGSCFFLPHGTRIYNALLDMLKSEYRKRNYEEVITPNIFKTDLWKTSGHWSYYEDSMFTFEAEKEKFGLKPMNCPAHCKIFAHRKLSYNDLPMRIADFGVLHRNEVSGALTGLTRVRRFQQDDAHIFCTQEQVGDEIESIFDFMSYVYGLFEFTFKLKLSTRPDKFLGGIEAWTKAELELKTALNSFAKKTGSNWEKAQGEGAFYGPKIDITMVDALHREHQCGTIQLDFQMPENFDLRFVTSEYASNPKNENKTQSDPSPGYARPVMIHRAIFGSFERMFAILAEHFAGKWPFWLSPRQILVAPVSSSANDYALEVQKLFKDKLFHVDVDTSNNTLRWKIHNGGDYNFILGNLTSIYL